MKTTSLITGVFLALAVITSNTSFAAVGGFVDAQVHSSGAGDTSNSPTFRVADGAIYLNEKSGNSSVVVDIPFKFTVGGATNTFDLATTKTQAYVSHKYECGLSWSLGQWDKIFGFENNDNINNRFTGQGFIYGNQPVTHTGVLLAYTSGPMEVKALVSNPNNTGLRNGTNFEYAGQFKYTHSNFYVSAGYLHWKSRVTDASRMLTDLVLGYNGSGLTADLNVILSKAAVTGVDTGVGFGGWFTYDVNKEWNVGTRLEYLSKVTAYSQFGFTFGPQYKFNDKFTTKLDYNMTSTKALQTTASSTTIHSGVLSGQFKF